MQRQTAVTWYILGSTYTYFYIKTTQDMFSEFDFGRLKFVSVS